MNKLGSAIFLLAIAAIVALWTVPKYGELVFGAAGVIIVATALIWGIYSAYHRRWLALILCMIAVLVLMVPSVIYLLVDVR